MLAPISASVCTTSNIGTAIGNSKALAPKSMGGTLAGYRDQD